LATFVDGEPVQIGGRSTRFDNDSFLDDANPSKADLAKIF
jgi:hypothetical protein